MTKHKKIYYSYFEINVHNQIRCELTGKYKQIDIHHIDARGMGGRPSADNIENLMAIWRSAHDYYGDKTRFKDFLRYAHDRFMETKTPLIETEPDNEYLQQFLEYENNHIRWKNIRTRKDDYRGIF